MPVIPELPVPQYVKDKIIGVMKEKFPDADDEVLKEIEQKIQVIVLEYLQRRYGDPTNP